MPTLSADQWMAIAGIAFLALANIAFTLHVVGRVWPYDPDNRVVVIGYTGLMFLGGLVLLGVYAFSYDAGERRDLLIPALLLCVLSFCFHVGFSLPQLIRADYHRLREAQTGTPTQ